MPANPLQHLARGTPARRCWHCASYRPDEYLSDIGDCARVSWIIHGTTVQQAVHPDDVCAKFEMTAASLDEREMRAVAVGLG